VFLVSNADPTVKDQLTSDHASFTTRLSPGAICQVQRITGHLARVAAEVEAEVTEARVLGLSRGGGDVRALNHKYLMTGRARGARLTIDRHESGFPVAQS
jgi:hypothetical protein